MIYCRRSCHGREEEGKFSSFSWENCYNIYHLATLINTNGGIFLTCPVRESICVKFMCVSVLINNSQFPLKISKYYGMKINNIKSSSRNFHNALFL